MILSATQLNIIILGCITTFFLILSFVFVQLYIYIYTKLKIAESYIEEIGLWNDYLTELKK